MFGVCDAVRGLVVVLIWLGVGCCVWFPVRLVSCCWCCVDMVPVFGWVFSSFWWVVFVFLVVFTA